MKVKAKVKSVQANGTWNGKDGTLYYRFDYVMDDDMSIQASHKKQEPHPIGAEVEYEVKRTHETYGASGTVSKPGEYRSSGDDNLKGIKIGHAITNAVHIVTSIPELSTDAPTIISAIKDWAKHIYKISEDLNKEL